MSSPPRETILLDASCLLNLYATGRLRDIAIALPQSLAVANYVLENEVLYIRRRGAEGEEWREPVDLSALIADGRIIVYSLHGEEEEATFLDLASAVDDGEAVTFSLAIHRGYQVATDDRKARRIIAAQAPHVPLVSTLEILKMWADLVGIGLQDLRDVMIGMWHGASYFPGKRNPLYEWWKTPASNET